MDITSEIILDKLKHLTEDIEKTKGDNYRERFYQSIFIDLYGAMLCRDRFNDFTYSPDKNLKELQQRIYYNEGLIWYRKMIETYCIIFILEKKYKQYEGVHDIFYAYFSYRRLEYNIKNKIQDKQISDDNFKKNARILEDIFDYKNSKFKNFKHIFGIVLKDTELSDDKRFFYDPSVPADNGELDLIYQSIYGILSIPVHPTVIKNHQLKNIEDIEKFFNFMFIAFVQRIIMRYEL